MLIIPIPFNGPPLPINIINNLGQLQSYVCGQLSQTKTWTAVSWWQSSCFHNKYKINFLRQFPFQVENDISDYEFQLPSSVVSFFLFFLKGEVRKQEKQSYKTVKVPSPSFEDTCIVKVMYRSSCHFNLFEMQ